MEWKPNAYSCLAGQALIFSQGNLQSGSRSRGLVTVQAGLGDRAARVVKGYSFFYGDSAGEVHDGLSIPQVMT